jgi:hypothetical protein
VAAYEYGRIKVLAGALEKAGVAEEVRAEIMAGGEAIGKVTSSEKKADWFRGAMSRMDALLPAETRHSIREACACCLAGKRQDVSKAIAKEHATLEERIAAANEARFVFGNRVMQLADGTVRVCFFPPEQTEFRCVCLPKSREPISITYCYCCGGHVKHHLQNALGRKLALTVRTTALSSGGREGCTFDFEVLG